MGIACFPRSNMQRSWIQRLVLSGVTVALAYLISNHFFTTFMHLSPMNPIKAGTLSYIESYTSDLFAQNWTLFAPTPLHNNSAFLVQCKTTDGADSQWLNLSQGLIDGLHKQPFGPYVRLVRLHITAIRYYQGAGDPGMEQLRQQTCPKDGGTDFCRRDDEETKQIRQVGTKTVARLASAACAQYGTEIGRTIASVRVRMLAATVRPVSAINDPNWQPNVGGMETEWLPFETVAPLPFKTTP
jgi:hypothetical protein